MDKYCVWKEKANGTAIMHGLPRARNLQWTRRNENIQFGLRQSSVLEEKITFNDSRFNDTLEDLRQRFEVVKNLFIGLSEVLEGAEGWSGTRWWLIRLLCEPLPPHVPSPNLHCFSTMWTLISKTNCRLNRSIFDSNSKAAWNVNQNITFRKISLTIWKDDRNATK